MINDNKNVKRAAVERYIDDTYAVVYQKYCDSNHHYDINNEIVCKTQYHLSFSLR